MFNLRITSNFWRKETKSGTRKGLGKCMKVKYIFLKGGQAHIKLFSLSQSCARFYKQKQHICSLWRWWGAGPQGCEPHCSCWGEKEPAQLAEAGPWQEAVRISMSMLKWDSQLSFHNLLLNFGVHGHQWPLLWTHMDHSIVAQNICLWCSGLILH